MVHFLSPSFEEGHQQQASLVFFFFFFMTHIYYYIETFKSVIPKSGLPANTTWISVNLNSYLHSSPIKLVTSTRQGSRNHQFNKIPI